MVHTNQQLSDVFQINLAKWKRWSREFLPPDPVAGMQCGLAREYNEREAFTVYLGGYLVGSLKFSIPDARMILNDLQKWFDKMDIYPLDIHDQKWSINIMQGRNGFFYEAKKLLERKCIDEETNIYREEYALKLFETSDDTSDVDLLNVRKLHVSNLIEVFLNKLGMIA
ncbi:hypothetical protein PITCH_A210007 [uncultured Desulfobacterium sp.]|uniref:Uncharacterized protein n=1 Tax=uncultured Desulfobacterium sp. TaxID=201089 RepID=A0A445MXT3_9BACT|nr:hypothetical protein PITCH_A210007 [uncultured Desulfobacterium sp.]